MTGSNRRVLRMLCKALLLISLPLVGFVWALPENSTMMIAAGGLTVLALAMGFGAEYLASSTENDLEELSERITAEGQRRAAALEERDEKLRQFDRMVALLTEQNHDLRAKLVAVQVNLQRQRQELAEVTGEEATLADTYGHNPYAARAH